MSIPSSYKGHRFSYTELNEIYFWTATIKDWINLLAPTENKHVIIDSLAWLCKKELARIYGYVIMPNHIHLLWEQLKMNGEEFPKNSLLKHTAHIFCKNIKTGNEEMLNRFLVKASDRQFNVWQRDPMAIQILSREMAFQKLDYIHHNPVKEKWKLSDTSEGYRFSSAAFYSGLGNEFGILTHIMNGV